jgi:pre-mRNA-splicing factor ATP-dependent RNA helicase DHX16
MSSKSSKQALSQWCSDALHDLLGFADAALASYLVSVASKAKSPQDILQVLKEGQVASADQLQSFSNRLYQQAKTTTDSSSSAPRGKRTNADWVQVASQYQLLEEDNKYEEEKAASSKKKTRNKELLEDDKEEEKAASSKKKTRKKKEAERDKKKESSSRRSKRRYHPSSSDEESSDGGGVEGYRRKAEERSHRRLEEKESKQESKLTEEERAELEREKDLKERDELVKRMLERDKSKTEKKVDDEEEEATYRKRIKTEEQLARGDTIVDEATGKELNLDRLREESRGAYLKKREERELALLKQSLEDEKELFKGVKLTEEERRRAQLGKQILGMVEDREGEQDKNDGFYRLPDEIDDNDTKANQDQALLSSRYVEPKHEKSEQDLWEESQTQKATALGSKKKKQPDEEKYELVFEDQIDFVMQETSKGYDRRKKVPKEEKEEASSNNDAPELTEHEKILAGRLKLPVYPYRDEFLAALKDHQVLILVGETGSGKVA